MSEARETDQGDGHVGNRAESGKVAVLNRALAMDELDKHCALTQAV